MHSLSKFTALIVDEWEKEWNDKKKETYGQLSHRAELNCTTSSLGIPEDKYIRSSCERWSDRWVARSLLLLQLNSITEDQSHSDEVPGPPIKWGGGNPLCSHSYQSMAADQVIGYCPLITLTLSAPWHRLISPHKVLNAACALAARTKNPLLSVAAIASTLWQRLRGLAASPKSQGSTTHAGR